MAASWWTSSRHGCMLHTLACVCLLLVGLQAAGGQNAAVAEFVSADIAAKAPARLVLRQAGFMAFISDPTIEKVVVREQLALDETTWRNTFASTGGTAVINEKTTPERRFIIVSDTPDASIAFNRIPGLILVDGGASLFIANTTLKFPAMNEQYTYGPSQPYRTQGTDGFMWPSIAVAPNSALLVANTSVVYENPATLDNCAQYTQRTVFTLQQLWPNSNIRQTGNETFAIGNLTQLVEVVDAASNTSRGAANLSLVNTTYSCVAKQAVLPSGDSAPDPAGIEGTAIDGAAAAPPSTAASSSGIAPGIIAAAVVVPVVVLAALAALATWALRRTKRRRAAQRRAAAAGLAPAGADKDVGPGGDGLDIEAGLDQGPRGGGSSVAGSSTRGMPLVAGGAFTTGGSAQTSSSTISSVAPYLVHGSSGRVPPGWKPPSGGPSVASGDVSTPATLAEQRIPTWGTGTTFQSNASQADSLAGPITSTAAGRTAGVISSGSGGGSGEAAEGGAGGSGSTTASERVQQAQSLLQSRSAAAVLRELKLGPVLGRGSYGRVHRARWKAATVAVKIIEHHEQGSAISSGGKRVNVGREAMLSTTISHPNVVQTYHISTMSVAARAALTKRLAANREKLEEDEPAAEGSAAPRTQRSMKLPEASEDSDSSQEGLGADITETWMIMEYCDKGSLERAIFGGRFKRKDDACPEMIGIYKALLDTASGLDYLHEMGVVHGDLKTANVLLKGNTRDPRGFVCKIADFGLSRVLDMDATHISTRTYGTIVYMPSELLLHGRMTPAVDVYSFGLMMWELYMGQRLFDESISIGQIFYLIAYEGWRPTIPEGCPPGYAELMVACWDPEAEQRPSMPEVLKQLQKLYNQEKHKMMQQRQGVSAGGGAVVSGASMAGAGSSEAARQGGGSSDLVAEATAAAGGRNSSAGGQPASTGGGPSVEGSAAGSGAVGSGGAAGGAATQSGQSGPRSFPLGGGAATATAAAIPAGPAAPGAGYMSPFQQASPFQQQPQGAGAPTPEIQEEEAGPVTSVTLFDTTGEGAYPDTEGWDMGREGTPELPDTPPGGAFDSEAPNPQTTSGTSAWPSGLNMRHRNISNPSMYADSVSTGPMPRTMYSDLDLGRQTSSWSTAGPTSRYGSSRISSSTAAGGSSDAYMPEAGAGQARGPLPMFRVTSINSPAAVPEDEQLVVPVNPPAAAAAVAPAGDSAGAVSAAGTPADATTARVPVSPFAVQAAPPPAAAANDADTGAAAAGGPRPAASPFAMLSQRAGSLFGPR